jgi:signal transduction histidine kinase
MTAHYDPVLVVTSIAIAIFASYVALDTVVRLSGPHRRGRRWWWLCAPAAMGLGIWSMHFVGMLAFHLQMPVGYDVALVVASVLVAIAASALALFVASRPSLPIPVLAVASLCMGAAISGMHYIGMAAMRLDAAITWRPSLVILSIVIAIGASFAALLLAFRLRALSTDLFHWPKLGAATLMGIAIAGMHYTGMAAAQFTPVPPSPTAGAALSFYTTEMAVAVIVGTVFILSMALAAAAFDERERLLTLEQQARSEAEAANRLKDEFLATLSHELRTPLNVILGRTQMLRVRPDEPARVAAMADTITRNAEALRHLVEDLLDVSRLTMGGMHLDLQPVDLAELLEAAADSLRGGAVAKGLHLTVSAPRGLPKIAADAARLQQVIWNLMANAVKFTPRGGHIRAQLFQENGSLVLSVSDTGRGIDREFVPHVFDMFRQAEPSARRTEGGLGIGLSIVQRLVEMHGGTASVTSGGPGQGSTFTVLLPHDAGASSRTTARRSDALALGTSEP